MTNKVNLFYSYSHRDESYRRELEKHLATLRKDGLIDEWHDRKIDAGDDLNEEIDKHMESAHIILLLFSPDFIDSEACDREVEKAVQLRSDKQVVVIPVILRPCSWDETAVANLMAVPTDAFPVSKWPDKDEAWQDVYTHIKKRVNRFRSQTKPQVNNDFIDNLLANPITNEKLNDHFVYPDISKPSDNFNNSAREIDSEKLTDLDGFGCQYVLIKGEEQSGKTSLCNILYTSYQKAGRYPVLINGKNISSSANIQEVMYKQYNHQYSHADSHWYLSVESRILLIDDADEITINNLPELISSIEDNFKYVIIFIDELSNLSGWSAEPEQYSNFQLFSINRLGHRKRDQLIKKCITHDENTDFDTNNTEHLARLDKNTEHINTIIGTNIVPSYPVFIMTIFNIVETITPLDLSQTSYGYCYHAMVIMNLGRAGIKPEDIDAYFNFLTQLAYSMFNEDTKVFSEEKLDQFVEQYNVRFIVPENIIRYLKQANILNFQHGHYTFQYIYVYYYFVARYIARELNNEDVRNHIEKLMLDIHKKENANILVFITHHTSDLKLLDRIIQNAVATFDKYPEATLSDDEKNFIKELSDTIAMPYTQLPDDDHDVEDERDSVLQTKDDLEAMREDMEDRVDQNDDPLAIEVRKSIKNMEIIGQILRNHYGSLERDTLEQLFLEGQFVGLRLLKSFIEFMREQGKKLEEFIHSKLEDSTKGNSLTTDEKTKISQKYVSQWSYGIILGLLHKIVYSLGYDKHIDIADAVNQDQKTVASNLINFSIHAWYTKKLDIAKLKRLYSEFLNDSNEQAIYILQDIVSFYLYMHPVGYKEKQKINSLLGFSVKKQVSIQGKLEKK